MIVLAPRAATILYNLLTARPNRRPFLLSANICPIVPLVFLKAGVPFKFVDVSPVTLNMNLDLAADRLRTGSLGGLLYSHTYGDESTPLDFFAEIKHLHPSTLVIDDRCLCIPNMEPMPENPADVLLYSTGYAKIVDSGIGGYAFIQSDIPYQSHSLPFRYDDLEKVETAYKTSIANRQPFSYHESDWLQTDGAPSEWEAYRDKISSALAGSLSHRRKINAIYATSLPVENQLPERYQLWRFNLRVADRQRTLNALFIAGLFASSHYASLAGIFTTGSCPQAEKLAGNVVNLFNDHHYTVEMAERTCEILRKEL
jgi:hypothetical protein